MLSQKLHKALNDQMTYELNSAYIYMGMAAYFHEENLEGMAGWMEAQAQEEVEHAMKFYSYIQERMAVVEWGALDKPANDYDSPLAAYKKSLEHEQSVTRRIHDLLEMAQAEKDHPTVSFLQWFVDEQVEEESSVDAVIQRLEQVGDFRPGLFFLDRELGQRGAGGSH
jgi:ferritin